MNVPSEQDIANSLCSTCSIADALKVCGMCKFVGGLPYRHCLLKLRPMKLVIWTTKQVTWAVPMMKWSLA